VRTADLVATARSDRLHVKASDIMPHSWYHEMFAGTLCGRWVRVDRVVTAVPLDTLASLDVAVCEVCVQKSRRFAR
jgi:hypothetical protein